VPDPTDLPNLDILSQYEAVALFIERARAVKDSFAVTNDNAPAVAEICARLDGLPLAIELAAARIKLFPPRALLARLSSRLTLLIGGAKDRPSRQQTLRNAIEWSYSLLSEEEQTLLARLSVFAGGCTFEAAEAVCNPEGELDLLDGMDSLVDKSLLRQEGETEPRFAMLETVREYVAEKLDGRGEGEMVRAAHAEYFLHLVEEAEPALAGPERGRLISQLATEHDNLRTALERSRDHRDGAILLRLAAALFPFWLARCHYGEGLRWLHEALALSGPDPTPARAKVLYGLSWMEDAEPRMQESLDVSRALGDKQGMARALVILGNIARNRGDADLGVPQYQEAERLAREVGDTVSLFRTSLNMGNIAVERGELDRAEHLFGESKMIAQQSGDYRAQAVAIANTGLVASSRGELDRAERLLTESLALLGETGDTWDMAWVRSAYADLILERGDAERARQMCEESLRAARETRERSLLVPAFETLATIAVVQGEPVRGVRLTAAATSFRGEDWPIPPSARPGYEQHLAGLRAQLDEATWTAAWSEGQAMTLEQAAAYALDRTEEGARRPL
jgi:tetratricopeptide (TPR) repeat protein